MNKPNFYQMVIVILLIIGIIIIVSSSVSRAHEYTRVRCSDFKTQQGAQKAYEQGAKYLDRNHDGIACNSLENYAPEN